MFFLLFGLIGVTIRLAFIATIWTVKLAVWFIIGLVKLSLLLGGVIIAGVTALTVWAISKRKAVK